MSSTAMPVYSDLPPFHGFQERHHQHQQHQAQSNNTLYHNNPNVINSQAGPSTHSLTYNDNMPTYSQPPQIIHSNSAPEIQLYEPPSVLAPVDSQYTNGFPTQNQAHLANGYTDGSLAGGSYTPDFHFGGPGMSQSQSHTHNQGGVMPHVLEGPPPGFSNGPLGPPEGDWDDDDMRESEMVYGNLEVKHRRRTSPDQLRVLEHWFSINPKPDNSLREWLANELGVTKRNVQVWFQNRRAKVKGLAMKERDKRIASDEYRNGGSESDPSAPNSATSFHMPINVPDPSAPMLLPPAVMGRRVSIANGEAARISLFMQKRQSGKPAYSPMRSPAGQLVNARRGSIPYPSPLQIPGNPSPSGNPLSPRASPVVRPMPSQLHLAAMRNNTRRASVPGAAQLITSGPFTPPRNVSGQNAAAPFGRITRELSPIKDHCEDRQLFTEPEFTTSFHTPPSSTYFTNTLTLPTDSTAPFSSPADGPPYTPFESNMPMGPLPAAGFSFGQQSNAAMSSSNSGGTLPDDQIYMVMMHQRGRMGSIASIGTLTTENGTDGSDWSGGDWLASPDGFETSSRRSSAPSDLLENLGLMGLAQLPSPFVQPLRPSPLGQTYQNDQPLLDGNTNTMDNCHTSDNMSDSLPTQFSPSQSLSPNTLSVHPNSSNGNSPIGLRGESIASGLSDPASQAISRSSSAGGPSPGYSQPQYQQQQHHANSAPGALGPNTSQQTSLNQFFTPRKQQHSQSQQQPLRIYTHSPLLMANQSRSQSQSQSQPQSATNLQTQLPSVTKQSWISPLFDSNNTTHNIIGTAPQPVRTASDTTTYSIPSLGYSSYTEGSGDSLFSGSLGSSLNEGLSGDGSNGNGNANMTREAPLSRSSSSGVLHVQLEDGFTSTNVNTGMSAMANNVSPSRLIGVGVGVGVGMGVGAGGSVNYNRIGGKAMLNRTVIERQGPTVVGWSGGVFDEAKEFDF